MTVSLKPLILLALSPSIYAATMGSWFINGQIGGQNLRAHATTTTISNGSGFPAPLDRDVYQAQQSKAHALLGLQGGKRWELNHAWFSAFSLAAQYQYFFASDKNGQIIQFSQPQFTNYSFQWHNASNLIMANAKLNLMNFKGFSPYLNAGVGEVFYVHQRYSESAYSGVTPRISPTFQKNSGGLFASILGAGIDYRFNQSVIINLGYQFSQLGTLSSGTGVGSWFGERLNFGTHHSNAFLLGLTYVFDNKSPLSSTK